MENRELSSEVQSLKEKLDEHSKKLEQSAEKLSQLESENLTLRDGNQALNTTINKKHRFRAQSRPMPTLETPNSGTNATLPHTASQGDAARAKRLMVLRPTTWKTANLSQNPIRKHPREQQRRILLWFLTWSRCSPRGSTPCSVW